MAELPKNPMRAEIDKTFDRLDRVKEVTGEEGNAFFTTMAEELERLEGVHRRLKQEGKL